MKIADQIEIACLMEATARKPGNVHPAAAFDDLQYDDFVRAAKSIADPLAAALQIGLGRAIFEAVQSTRVWLPHRASDVRMLDPSTTRVEEPLTLAPGEPGTKALATGTNVNLGIVLLLAPLAAVPEDVPLEVGLPRILQNTTIEDAEQVYAAIRLAQPGGMGNAPSQDIRDRPTVNLRDAMALAANRDRIAEQYVTDGRLVFQARSKLCELVSSSMDWETAVVSLYLWILASCPDTLIARKCGLDFATQVSRRAKSILETHRGRVNLDSRQLAEFDRWLREDGHRRNPGTTADLIAATLFAAARDGLIELPSRTEIEQLASRIRIETNLHGNANR